MLWTICVILSMVWFLGLFSGYEMGNSIHVLLVMAIIVLVVQESLRGDQYCRNSDPCRRRCRYLERRAFRRSGKILPKLAMLSREKISQPISSPQTYREE